MTDQPFVTGEYPLLPNPEIPTYGDYASPREVERIMAIIDRSKGSLRVGRLLLAWPVRQGFGTPIIDGCTTVQEHRDDETHEVIDRVTYGGVALRPWWSMDAVAVTWRGARMPNTRRTLRWLRPRFLASHVRWLLAGRPLSGVIGDAGEPTDGTA
jgi:hypothetical protein